MESTGCRVGYFLSAMVSVAVSVSSLVPRDARLEPAEAAPISHESDASALGADELHVRVLDAHGAPAELAFLELVALDSGGSAPSAECRTLGVTATDGNGEVALPRQARGTMALELRVIHMGFMRLVRRIDPPYPAELELRLPAGGILDVEPRGMRYDARSYRVCVERVGDDWGGVGTRVETTRVVFHDVPIGGSYRVHLEHGSERSSRTVAGPSRAGERVGLRIEELPPPQVTGVGIDERSLPLAGALEAHLLVAGTGRRVDATRSFRARFDADGMFRIELSSVAPGVELALRAVDGHGAEVEARVPLSAMELGDEQELGTLWFEHPPLAVSGRVLDAKGQPVVLAEVRALEQDPRGRLRPVHKGVWTDSLGRFEVRARITAGTTVLVRARDATGRAAGARGLAAGTDGIELRLD